jgi:copper chaperone CopZ
MKLILALIFTTSFSTFAATTTIKVNGMHCGGCRAMVEKAVCQNAELKSSYSKCTVTVDAKIQVGTLIFETEKNQFIDQSQVTKLIEDVSDDYKVSDFKTK